LSKVILGITTSLDGFVAGEKNSVSQPLGEGGLRLHQWFFNPTPTDDQIMNERMETTAAVILGAKTYRDSIDEAWGGQTPFHAPAFVLTHHLPERVIDGFTFVSDGIDSALRQARRVAGEKDVWLMGGANVLQQYLEAGLVDEIYLHVAPVLFGQGTRLFDHIGSQHVELNLEQVTQTPDALHMRYRVIRSV
jgi:dihydrofolate reductase